jgi:hypothetical protein
MGRAESRSICEEGSLSSLSKKYGVTSERERQIAKGLGITYYTKAEKDKRAKAASVVKAAQFPAQRQANARSRRRAIMREELHGPGRLVNFCELVSRWPLSRRNWATHLSQLSPFESRYFAVHFQTIFPVALIRHR